MKFANVNEGNTWVPTCPRCGDPMKQPPLMLACLEAYKLGDTYSECEKCRMVVISMEIPEGKGFNPDMFLMAVNDRPSQITRQAKQVLEDAFCEKSKKP